jgi:hypothetical protein
VSKCFAWCLSYAISSARRFSSRVRFSAVRRSRSSSWGREEERRGGIFDGLCSDFVAGEKKEGRGAGIERVSFAAH